MMQAYLVVALIFSVLVAVFAIQNVGPVEIQFLTWKVQEISLVLVILGSALIGAAVIFLLGIVKQISNHRQIKDLRRKNDELEKVVETLEDTLSSLENKNIDESKENKEELEFEHIPQDESDYKDELLNKEVEKE
ncbi:MAG: hypothetical protein APF76_08265 [Desulfitibacter sp. BRH_c19]|nr:MAG: hypothetical protein APF76_08265 [Desulfitibacter sp. BRH_c19]